MRRTGAECPEVSLVGIRRWADMSVSAWSSAAETAVSMSTFGMMDISRSLLKKARNQPTCIHCDAAQFIEFGEFVAGIKQE